MSLRKQFTRLASASLDLLFPPRCVSCNREGHFLCDACLDSLPHLLQPYCTRCAQPVEGGDTCGRCSTLPLDIDGIRSPFLMEGAVREAIHRLKYSNLRAIAPVLGRLLSDFLASQEIAADVLVPVPLHPRRQRQRGYNQAHLLAKEVGSRLGIPVTSHALSRSRDTPPQARSPSAQERRTNVAHSFRCTEHQAIAGQKVLLVDDVCTTGATLEACAIALKEAGAASVWGVALAREA